MKHILIISCKGPLVISTLMQLFQLEKMLNLTQGKSILTQFEYIFAVSHGAQILANLLLDKKIEEISAIIQEHIADISRSWYPSQYQTELFQNMYESDKFRKPLGHIKNKIGFIVKSHSGSGYEIILNKNLSYDNVKYKPEMNLVEASKESYFCDQVDINNQIGQFIAKQNKEQNIILNLTNGVPTESIDSSLAKWLVCKSQALSTFSYSFNSYQSPKDRYIIYNCSTFLNDNVPVLKFKDGQTLINKIKSVEIILKRPTQDKVYSSQINTISIAEEAMGWLTKAFLVPQQLWDNIKSIKDEIDKLEDDQIDVGKYSFSDEISYQILNFNLKQIQFFLYKYQKQRLSKERREICNILMKNYFPKLLSSNMNIVNLRQALDKRKAIKPNLKDMESVKNVKKWKCTKKVTGDSQAFSSSYSNDNLLDPADNNFVITTSENKHSNFSENTDKDYPFNFNQTKPEFYKDKDKEGIVLDDIQVDEMKQTNTNENNNNNDQKVTNNDKDENKIKESLDKQIINEDQNQDLGNNKSNKNDEIIMKRSQDKIDVNNLDNTKDVEFM